MQIDLLTGHLKLLSESWEFLSIACPCLIAGGKELGTAVRELEMTSDVHG